MKIAHDQYLIFTTVGSMCPTVFHNPPASMVWGQMQGIVSSRAERPGWEPGWQKQALAPQAAVSAPECKDLTSSPSWVCYCHRKTPPLWEELWGSSGTTIRTGSQGFSHLHSLPSLFPILLVGEENRREETREEGVGEGEGTCSLPAEVPAKLGSKSVIRLYLSGFLISSVTKLRVSQPE